jgi:hypothetical protein
VNARALGLAALALGTSLAVTCALRWLGRGDATARSPSPEERSGASAPGMLDALAGEWLRPGALSAAHAHLEGAARCTLCHGRADHVPDARCESCHEEIALRAARRVPLHGRFEGDCASCHVEHAGVDAPLVELDRDAFAHGQTRFALSGAHASLDCEACHRLGEAGREPAFHYQGVPFDACRACHSDPHAGGIGAAGTVGTLVRVALDAPAAPGPARDAAHPLAGRDCSACHAEASFRVAALRSGGFSHAEDTHLALHGAHEAVRCEACHTPELRDLEQRDALAPGTAAEPSCGSCHRDPHRGALGGAESCARCHSPRGWSQDFDHARDTRFALDPLHAALRCESCHTDDRYRATGRDCEACHPAAADLLAGRFGAEQGEPDPHHGALACTDCHGPTPAANRPPALAARCADCHDSSYSALLVTWRARLDEAAASARGDAARRDALRASGPHNFALAHELLRAPPPAAR